MKLIKINTDHYVIVDDSEIKEGDWVYQPMTNAVYKTSRTDNSDIGYKITHSTQPLEAPVAINGYGSYEYISLQEVKELIGEVDVQIKAEKELKFHSDWNWIMEVVEAIEKLGYATEISHDYCISNYGCDKCEIDTRNNALREIGEPPIVFSLTKTKQEAVVEAINQFLIWYEQNKTV